MFVFSFSPFECSIDKQKHLRDVLDFGVLDPSQELFPKSNEEVTEKKTKQKGVQSKKKDILKEHKNRLGETETVFCVIHFFRSKKREHSMDRQPKIAWITFDCKGCFI